MRMARGRCLISIFFRKLSCTAPVFATFPLLPVVRGTAIAVAFLSLHYRCYLVHFISLFLGFATFFPPDYFLSHLVTLPPTCSFVLCACEQGQLYNLRRASLPPFITVIDSTRSWLSFWFGTKNIVSFYYLNNNKNEK
uniref:Uncharacterized protein n=1 Tax=Trypanosoma vivax (strain Y486) TaxID=1055687 RepID=G0U7Q8_TRYVY|nr:hypothetical protein TVY486_1009610 [Trypanosoma vivax Y486]